MLTLKSSNSFKIFNIYVKKLWQNHEDLYTDFKKHY